MDPFTAIFINIIVGLVLSVGSTLLQQALAPKPKQQAATVPGFRGQVQTGGTVNQSFLIGTIGSAGKLEYRSTWGDSGGTPNAYLVDVISFGDLTIAGSTPQAMWVNTQPVTVSASSGVTQGYQVAEYNSSGDHLWWIGHDGTQTTADSYLTGTFGSDPDRPWQTDMIGRQMPLLIVTALVAENLWTGFPTVVAQWQGIKLYDPRQDTTAGGSGSQRWDDASTWAFSDNSIVIVYNILRGIHDADGNHVWGGSLSAYQLPYAPWAAAMDACDEDVDLAGGGTEKRFRGGREVFLNERPADVIAEFLTGANARIAWAGGQCFPLVGLPDSADGTFTDVDVLASEAITQTPFPNLDEVINGGTASYMEPSQAWEFKDTAPYYRSDLEAEDDGRRQIAELKLTTTFSGTQAQRVLKATIEEGRRFLKWAVALTPGFAQYRPLQVLAWTSEENQYDGKLFLIIARTVDPWGNVFLGLQEIDPADHDWTPGTDEQPLSFAPLTPIGPAPIPMTGWDAEPYVYPDAAGAERRIGIKVTFAGGMPDVMSVRIQVREGWLRDGETEKAVIWDSGDQPYDVSEADPVTRSITWAGILPNTDYEVRGRFISPPASGRTNDWSDWIAVTTANVPPVGAAEIIAAAQSVLTQLGQVRTLIEQFMQFGTLIEAQDRDNFTTRQALSRSIQTQLGNLEASFTEIIEVALGPGGAIATALESLYAALGGNTSEVNVRWEAVAAPDGYSARYAIQAAVNDGTFRSATLFLDVPADTGQPTRIGLMAGQTVFFTSDGTPLALIGDDGVFKSANDVVQIDMINGNFSITVA